MNNLALSIPEWGWPIVSVMIGFAIVSWIFSFMTLYLWLRNYIKILYGFKKALGIIFTSLFAIFGLGTFVIPGLIVPEHAGLNNILGSVMLWVGAIPTALALYFVPSSAYDEIKNKIYVSKKN